MQGIRQKISFFITSGVCFLKKRSTFGKQAQPASRPTLPTNMMMMDSLQVVTASTM